MPAVEEPAPRLTLADFGGPDAPPDDTVQPPKNGGAAPDENPTADPKAIPQEPEISPLNEEVDEPEKAEKEKKPKADPEEPEKRLGDVMDDPVEIARKEAADAKAKEKKDAEAAEAAKNQTEDEKAKAAAATAAEERDKDLSHDFAPHTHQKTRQVITKMQAAAKSARDGWDREKAERAAEVEQLKKERDELAEKSKSAAPSKEVEEEIKTLRERVRELDITKDPALEQKYDRKITSNNDAIVAVLKANGLGTRQIGDGKTVETPEAVQAFVNGGISAKTVYPMIVRLRKAAAEYEKNGQESEAIEAMKSADDLQAYLRDNDRISREKSAEVETWKGDYTKRQQDREQQTKQQQEQRSQAFRAQTDTILKKDLAALATDFNYINQPPAPLPTDTPATRQAKETAIAEWTHAAKAIENRVKAFSTDGLSPDKLVEAVGKLNASAIKAVVYDEQVLPRVKKEMAALTARNKELEAELSKIRDAGKLSRQHTSASADPGYNGKPEPKSLEEAFQVPGN